MLGMVYKIKSIVTQKLEGVNHIHYYLCRQLKGGGMEIDMKRVIIYLCFTMCSFCFVGCAKQSKDSLENVNLQILVDETGNEKIVIPDPEGKEENKKVVLPYLESLNNKEDLSMVDLSFCGLNNAKIIGYDIGSITSEQTIFFHVQHNFSDNFQDKIKISEAEDKKVLGNCLVLFVSVEVESGMDDNYIVVLDYINGKNYISKTIIENYGDWFPQLYISDITNDGLDDIIVTNYRNLRNTGMVCEFLRFNNNSIKSIYKSEETNAENNTIIRSAYFEGHLEDNYRVVIEVPGISFKKSISLLDIGFQSKDLEIKRTPNNSANEKDYSCHLYDNKKIASNVNVTLYVSTLDDEKGVQVIKKTNMKSVIRLMYRIYMPNHVDYIGNAYAYMSYDSNTDSMEITSASVDFAESEETP